MESAFCAGVKEIGGDIEPPPPRSPCFQHPELTEGDEDRSPMHELRKSAQLHSVHFSFGVGEPPREEGLLKDKLQRAMSSHDGKDEGSAAAEKDCRDMREFSPSAHPKELEFDLTPAHEPPGGGGWEGYRKMNRERAWGSACSSASGRRTACQRASSRSNRRAASVASTSG